MFLLREKEREVPLKWQDILHLGVLNISAPPSLEPNSN